MDVVIEIVPGWRHWRVRMRVDDGDSVFSKIVYRTPSNLSKAVGRRPGARAHA